MTRIAPALQGYRPCRVRAKGRFFLTSRVITIALLRLDYPRISPWIIISLHYFVTQFLALTTKAWYARSIMMQRGSNEGRKHPSQSQTAMVKPISRGSKFSPSVIYNDFIVIFELGHSTKIHCFADLDLCCSGNTVQGARLRHGKYCFQVCRKINKLQIIQFQHLSEKEYSIGEMKTSHIYSKETRSGQRSTIDKKGAFAEHSSSLTPAARG